MADKVQKIKDFLVGMAGASCYDAKTKKNIETIILPFIDSLQEEPVSEDLEKAAIKYAQDKYMPVQTSQAFKTGAKWQKGRTINKACEWLHNNIMNIVNMGYSFRQIKDAFINEDFRKAMED